MPIKKQTKNLILGALGDLSGGATVSELEQAIGMERHTLTKHLSVLKGQGEINYKQVGRAKLWSINKAPLTSILTTEPTSVAEHLLFDILRRLPLALMVLDDHWHIKYLNTLAKEQYGDIEESHFYESVMGLEHPLSLEALRRVVLEQEDEASGDYTDTKGRRLRINAFAVSGGVIMLLDDVSRQGLGRHQET